MKLSRQLIMLFYSFFPCFVHAHEGHHDDQAQEHLEISQGFPFVGHGTADEDLKAIAKTVEDNSMPPGIYGFFHPSSHLTKDEKTKILGWVSESQTLIKQTSKPGT